MIHKKTFMLGLAGIALGSALGITAATVYIESPKPKDLARVYEIERNLQNTTISLADLLNLSGGDPKNYALQLVAERDSLRALPNFKLTEENYRKSEEARKMKNKIGFYGGLAIMFTSAIFAYKGSGIYD